VKSKGENMRSLLTHGSLPWNLVHCKSKHKSSGHKIGQPEESYTNDKDLLYRIFFYSKVKNEFGDNLHFTMLERMVYYMKTFMM
jgi:hypothetical protein